MLIHSGTCSVDYKVSVFTYNNGNIQKLKDINTFSGGYLGYSTSKKVCNSSSFYSWMSN